MNQIRRHETNISFLESSTQRFALLNEVFKVLAIKGIDPENLLEVLIKSCSGQVVFDFGNVLIQLEHSMLLDIYGKDRELAYKHIVEVAIALNNGFSERTISCKYTPKELDCFTRSCQKAKEPDMKQQSKNGKPNKAKSAIAKNKTPRKEKLPAKK